MKRKILIILGLCLLGLKAEEPSFEVVNQALQIPLFEDDNLWDDSEKEVAARLKWPQESRTDTLASYRLYAGKEVSVLGARPYSLAFYSEKEMPQQISIIFSNKGDIEQAAPRDGARVQEKEEINIPQVLKILNASIKRDEEAISSRLKEILGEPRGDGIGVGRQMEQTSRWDWKGHSILLVAVSKEYASIRILPTEAADQNGKVGRISDDELKESLRSRVEKRSNGDVVIQQIPMVDQGPKGYCVPATFERQLRYLGIPCDLYLLAMKAGTQLGGGTYVDGMIESIKSLCSIYGRSIQFPKAEFETKILAKSIDQGILLIWTCLVNREHDHKVSKKSIERLKVQNWEDWKQELLQDRKEENLPTRDIKGGHVRMIIGYNADTREVAFSDSWGERFVERWMTYEEAEAITQGNFVVIQP